MSGRRDDEARTGLFRGHILGVGSASGVRAVVGRWRQSPLGSFADVMVALPDGWRVLLAPSTEVADYVGSTYHFDEFRIVDVQVTGRTEPGGMWDVEAGPLRMSAEFGDRPPLGRLLRAVPTPLSTSWRFTAVTDPVARVVMPGVRTRGTAGGGRREYYGAHDLLSVTGLRGEWEDTPLGALASVTPTPRFGFSGTPAAPGVTAVTTTIRHG